MKSGSLFLVSVRPSVLTYVRTKTQIKELNHFSNFCLGWCLSVNHCTTQVLNVYLFQTFHTHEFWASCDLCLDFGDFLQRGNDRIQLPKSRPK